MRLAVLIAMLVGCAVDHGPSATYHIELVDASDPALADYQLGARAWAELGIEEDPAAETVIWVDRFPHLYEAVGAYAMTDRSTRLVTIDTRLEGFHLWVAAAHEVGHVVLDTGEHTSCGVMGGYDVALCDEDRALACKVAGFCE